MKLTIDEALLQAFTDVSGDRNPLHVDEQFARRSQFRERVVYGMLPVTLLAVLPALRRAGRVTRPVSVSARFSEPVILGDVIELFAAPREDSANDAGATFDFEVGRDRDGAICTSGVIDVVFESMASDQDSEAPGDVEMPVDLGDPAELTIDAISKGDNTQIAFRASAAARARLASALSSIGDHSELAGDSDLGGFLAAAMLSTLVGMRLPGKQATFLDFSLVLAAPIREDVDITLAADVSHVSAGARVMMTRFSMTAGESVVAQGKVTARVNSPAAQMPTMNEIDETANLGLDGKVALVTGASRGLGETIAKTLARNGCHVVVNFLRGADDAQRVADEIRAAGYSAQVEKADVCDREQVEQMVERVVDEHGRVDILVNNAVRDFRAIATADLTWDDIQGDIDVSVRGAFNCCTAVLPLMKAQSSGKIVSMASIAVEDPPPDQLKYVISKSALVGLTRGLAKEVAHENIQVNLVVPNFVETDLVAHIPEGFRNRIAEAIPMQRLARPTEVAQAVLFLASDLSAYTTGQKIMVTGGAAPYL